MNHFPVLLRELACAVRQPGPCVRALCEAVAMLLSKNMTCARPRCNAMSGKHFPHTSHCILHTPHSTLHTCTSSQLISSELFSSHFMSSHMPAKFFLAIFMSSERSSNLSHLTEASLNSSRLFCTSESLRHRCIYTEESLQNTLCYKACTKHLPVVLCTTKLAQTTSQY